MMATTDQAPAPTGTAATYCVRLKAYNPKIGCVLQRFTYRGIVFEDVKGWYRVVPNVARYLQSVRQISHDETSPKAFDVVTEAEATKIAEREYRQAVAAGRVQPGQAPIMRARDTTGAKTPRAKLSPLPDEEGYEAEEPDAIQQANIGGDEPGESGDVTTADLRPAKPYKPAPRARNRPR